MTCFTLLLASPAVRRSLLTILTVAALSGVISRLERAPAADAGRSKWVRTVDGWEPRWMLVRAVPSPSPQVHPGLVAALQLGASMLALVAFPARVAVVRPPAEGTARPRRRTAAKSPDQAWSGLSG